MTRVFLLCLTLAACMAARAADTEAPEEAAPAVPAVEAAAAAAETPPAAGPEEGDGDEEEPSDWFWFVTTSNYHNKLKTSESRIDRQINGLFSLLFPRWRRVTTFQDWRDDWMIWDLTLGVGRDINESLAWTVYAGGGQGTIRNRDTYGLPPLFPVSSKVYFTRQSINAGASIRWWPWGRPEKTEKGILGALKGTKPVTEMNAGYSRQLSEAEVRMWTPLTGDAFRIRQKDIFHLFWASPRAGVEIPLSDTFTFNALGGYLFFHDQQDDFNGWMLETFLCGRF